MISLTQYITDSLNGMDLSLPQQATLAGCSGGSFVPTDETLAWLEAFDMVDTNDIDGLLKLLKTLPAQVVQSDALANFLNISPTAKLSKVSLADSTSLEGTPLSSRLWRMNHMYTIIDKEHKQHIIKLNKAQDILDEKLAEHPRVIVLKSRQRGISTYAIVRALDVCLTQPNKVRGLQADNLLSANALMEKAKLAVKAIPSECRPSIVYENNSELSFSNGSKLRISTSFRGQTLSSLHVSELGKISLDRLKAKELQTGTFPAIPLNRESEIVLESTSEGAGNMFHSMFTEAEADYDPDNLSTFLPLFIGWVGIIEAGILIPDTEDPDCSLPVPENDQTVVPPPLEELLIQTQIDLGGYKFSEEQLMWAIGAYKLLGSDIAEFKKEYPATVADCWASSTEGLIMAESFNMAESNPVLDWHPKYPRYAASDLGVDDTATIVFFQYYGGRMYIVKDYHNTGKDIAHYTALVIREGIDLWFLPHDANARDVSTAKKVVTHIRIAGFTNYRVLRVTKSVWTDLSRVRSFMPRVTFGNVPSLTNSLKAYRKVWSNQTGTYLDKPLHDEASHYADGFRYAVIGTLDFL